MESNFCLFYSKELSIPNFGSKFAPPVKKLSEYNRVVKDFLKLEKKLKVISNELKSRIFETEWRDVDSGDGGEVRKEIRADTYSSSQAEKNQSDQQHFSNLTHEDERLEDPLASLVKQESETEYYAAEEEEMLIPGDIVRENDDDNDVDMPITTTRCEFGNLQLWAIR
ncbi:hypothetical protein Ocin01_16638 [Orchesella cincta]|uniref:Uncharacterized protein n=1 Tax=Orchesella cincta TaxID=48709 RepID=A0A1D2MAZ1_ORCCI|nr:hypothetical protein Ocin01_16638 [Orchesella cincta]